MVAIGLSATQLPSNSHNYSLREDIRTILESVGFNPLDKELDLLIGTMSVESDLGKYVIQHNGGPAIGVYQMEPSTLADIKTNYLSYRPVLAQRVQTLATLSNDEFIASFEAQTVFCYIHYLRYNAFDMITLGDVESYATAWKKTYNSYLGKGTIEKFIEKYEEYQCAHL